MVRNQSHLLTSVTAVKDWGSTPEDRREPVVVTLLCGGVPLSGTEYTQTLSSSNSWTYQWPDLPLFMNGKLAEYTLHEAMIGGTTYDKTADPSDGYANYQVTYDAAHIERTKPAFCIMPITSCSPFTTGLTATADRFEYPSSSRMPQANTLTGSKALIPSDFTRRRTRAALR